MERLHSMAYLRIIWEEIQLVQLEPTVFFTSNEGRVSPYEH